MSIQATIFIFFVMAVLGIVAISIIIHVLRVDARMERLLGKDVWRNGKDWADQKRKEQEA